MKPTVRDSRTGRIQLGDVIVAVDGKRVDNSNDLLDALDGRKVGESVALVILRDGVRKELTVTLTALPRD